MKITLTKTDRKRDLNFVFFECAYGNGRGVWQGDKAEIGSAVNVEFDVENLRAAKKLVAAERRYGIGILDNITYIIGDIVDVQDEIICFRFAETLLQIDCYAEMPAVGEWIALYVSAKNFSIFPINL